MTTALIDLDAPATSDAAPKPPRRLLVGVIGLVLLVLLGTGEPVRAANPPAIVAARPQDPVFVDGNRMFVVESATKDGTPTLRTYELPSTRLLSRFDLPYAGPVTWVTAAGPVTLVSFGLPAETLAVDPVTGELRWKMHATELGVGDGLAMMADEPAETDDTTDGAAIGVDLTTGRIRWRVEQPAGDQLLVDGLPSWAGSGPWLGRPGTAGLPRWVLTTTLEGVVTAYDGHTGKPTGRTTIEIGSDGYGLVAGGRLFLASPSFSIPGQPDATDLEAFTLPGLRPAWQETLPVQLVGIAPTCVRVLCGYLAENRMIALDPATGHVRWRRNSQAETPYGEDLLDLTGPLEVLDAATGRSNGRLGGWQPIFDPDRTTLRMLKHSGPAGTTYFGVLDPVHGTVRLLGSAAGVDGRCDVGTGAVVYRRADGSVRVFRT